MISIKLTPFILFLILLIILVISSIFGKSLIVEKNGFQNNLYEGFQEGMITNGLISGPMPHYSTSNNVWTLYDNINFDDKNGNLIEVSGIISNVNDDTGGNTITNNSVTTIVTDRTGGTSTNYVTTKDTSQNLYLSQLNN